MIIWSNLVERVAMFGYEWGYVWASAQILRYFLSSLRAKKSSRCSLPPPPRRRQKKPPARNLENQIDKQNRDLELELNLMFTLG